MSVRARLAFFAVLVSLISVSGATSLRTDGRFVGPRGPGAPNALAQAPSDQAVVYASFKSAGVYRSTDGGLSFQPNEAGPFTSHTVTCLAVHPTNPNVVIAGASTEYDSSNRKHATIWRSENGGTSWRLVFADFYNDFSAVHTIRFAPGNSDVALAGLTYTSWISDTAPVVRSADGGATWSQVPMQFFDPAGKIHNNGSVSSFVFDQGSPGRVLCGFGARDNRSNYGMYASTNWGETWSRLDVPPFKGSASTTKPVFDLLQVPASGRIYAASSVDTYMRDYYTLYKSDDGGLSWTTATQAVSAVNYQKPSLHSIYRLIPDPANPARFWAVSSPPAVMVYPYDGAQMVSSPPVSVSTDGGETWTSDSPGIEPETWMSPSPDVQGLVVGGAGAPPLIAAVTNYGLFRREAGGGFVSRPGEFLLSNVAGANLYGRSAVATVNNSDARTDTLLVASGSASGWRWRPAQHTTSTRESAPIVRDPQDPSRLIALASAEVLRSTDWGYTWLPLGIKATGIGLLPTGSILFGCPGLLRSTDFGDSTSPFGSGLGLATAFDFAFGSPNRIAVAAQATDTSLGSGVYIADGSGAFQKRNHSIPLANILVDLAWCGGSEPRAFAFSSGAVVHTASVTGDWQSLSSVPYSQFHAVSEGATSRTLWAATSSLAYRSTDDGATWQKRQPEGQFPGFQFIATAESADTVWIYDSRKISSSTDRGDTWTTAPVPGGSYSYPDAFTVAPSNPQRMLVADLEKLYISDNGGQAWSQLPLPSAMASERMVSVTVAPDDANRILVGTQRNIWRSANGGATWVVWNIPSSGWRDIYQISFAPSNSQIVYAYDDEPFFYRSIDGGATWTTRGSTHNDLRHYSQSYSRQMAVSPTNPDELLFSMYLDTIYRSTDAGATWSPASTSLENAWVESVAVSSGNSDLMIAGTRMDGIYKTSDNGLNWTCKMPKVWNYCVNHVVANPQDADEFLAATDWGLFVSRDGGETWQSFVPELAGLTVQRLDLVPDGEGVGVVACTKDHGIWSSVPLPPPAADLSVEQVVSPDSCLVGGVVSFAVTVTNNGPDAASNLVISDAIPADCQLVSVSASNDDLTHDDSAVTVTVSQLAAESSVTLLVVVRPLVAGTITNHVQARSEIEDLNPSNNASDADATIVAPPPAADLSVEQVVSPASCLVGGELSFTVTVTNNGPDAASNLVISDSIPADCQLVSVSAGNEDVTHDDSAVTVTVSQLAAESSVTLLVVVRPLVAGTITNHVQARSEVEDLNPSNNASDADATIVAPPPAADLSVEQSVSPASCLVGGELSFTVTVTNNGPDAASNLVISDIIPANCQLVSVSAGNEDVTHDDSAVTVTVSQLAAESSVTLLVVVRPLVAGTITNHVQARSEVEDLNPSNNASDADATITATGQCDLAGEWSGVHAYSPPHGRGRASATGRFTLRNVGTVIARNVNVEFYASADRDLDASDQRIGRHIVRVVSPGTRVSFQTTGLASIRPTYVIAVIDPTGRVGETNKANNVIAGAAE